MTTEHHDDSDVPLLSRWKGISGNVMEVVEIDGDKARLEYVTDREDGDGVWWETLDDITSSFDRIS